MFDATGRAFSPEGGSLISAKTSAGRRGGSGRFALGLKWTIERARRGRWPFIGRTPTTVFECVTGSGIVCPKALQPTPTCEQASERARARGHSTQLGSDAHKSLSIPFFLLMSCLLTLIYGYVTGDFFTFDCRFGFFSIFRLPRKVDFLRKS